MSDGVIYVIGTREVLRLGPGEAVVSLGPVVLGGGTPVVEPLARAVLRDLMGTSPTRELSDELAKLLRGGPLPRLLTEADLDEWSARFGLKLGKRGVRGL